MAETYGLRLGPLRFVTAISDVAETLGDQLEQVGASVIPGDRRPRPFNLEIPVRAASGEADPYAKGMQLRRQVRQLMENTEWRMQGLPFSWDIDPDLDCWLLIGGGDLTEIEDGLTFGEFKLSLTDCYIAGRPGTHRQGRRLDLGDRRTGLVPRDSFGLEYNTDFSSEPVPSEPLVLPAAATSIAAGEKHGISTRWLPDKSLGWNAQKGVNGAVATFDRPINDTIGDVRVWDTVSAGRPSSRTAVKDANPDLGYGWERVCGPELSPTLAIENGSCRCQVTQVATTQWILIDGRQGDATYGPAVQVTWEFIDPQYADAPALLRTMEVTPERSVLELSDGVARLRIILQRGWLGPRIEVATGLIGGSTAPRIDVTAAGATIAVTVDDPGTPEVETLSVSGTRRAFIVKSSANLTSSSPNSTTRRWTLPSPSTKPLGAALQFEVDAASWGLVLDAVGNLPKQNIVDARSVPVLVER